MQSEFEQTTPAHHPRKPSAIKRIFRWFWKALKSYFMGIGILVTLLYFIVLFSVGKSGNTQDTVDLSSSGFMVKMQLKGQLSDQRMSPKEQLWAQITGEPLPYAMPDVMTGLRRLKADERAKGLFIDFSLTKGNLSQILRIHEGLKEIRKARKDFPIYFYSDNLDNSRMIISSTSNEIAIPPVSSILLTGPALELTYFGGAAKKLGIGFTVFKTGPHKSAFEPYVNTQPSKEVRAEYQALEKEIRNYMVEEVAQNRGLPQATVRYWFSESLFTVENALSKKIVTKHGYPDEFFEEFKTKLSLSDDPVSLMEYASSSRSVDENQLSKTEDAIGYIKAIGTIMNDDPGDQPNPDEVQPAPMIEQIKWAMEDQNVKAVVLRISSPGGSAQASELIWKHLDNLAKTKPLIVSMGAVAASGGYYLAAPAKHIVSEPLTITGSIGVTALIPDAQDLQEKIGVYFYTISDSQRTDLLGLGKKPNEADIVSLNTTIQEVYQTFLDRVSKGRNRPKSELVPLAGGRIYTGLEALRVGLVDEIGSLPRAFEIAKKEAGLDTTKFYKVRQYEGQSMSLLECIKSGKLQKCLGAKTSVGGGPFEKLVKLSKLIGEPKRLNVLTYMPTAGFN